MQNFFVWFKSRDHQRLLAILALAALLIFFRLDRADLQTDGSLYSARALRLFDFLDTSHQTTPIQWFETLPAWTRLSFHDAPPLAFWVQHIFFRALGPSTLVARLPGALAGLASVLLAYLIAARLWGVRAGQWAAVLLASSTLFTWAAREPYLESQAIAWVLLATYAFLRALQDPRWWLAAGAALGAALLTKYTTAFFIPAALIYLLQYHRAAFKTRHFWLGVLLTALLLSPVAVYNLKLYQTRGHLDLQLSRLVPSTWPQAKAAWPKLYADVGAPVDRAGYATTLVRYLAELTSLGYFALVAAGAGWLTRRFAANWRTPQPTHLAWLALLMAGAILVFTAPAPRLLPLLSPLLAVAAGGLIASISASQSDRMVRLATVVTVGVLVLTEIAFNFNTNHTLQPRGAPGRYAASLRLGNNGFAQLGNYLESTFTDTLRTGGGWISSRADLQRDFQQISGHDVFVYQGNLQWFSTFWYLQRHGFSKDVYLLSDLALGEIAKAWGEDVKWIQFFKDRGVRRFIYIAGVSNAVFEPSVRDDPRLMESQTEAVFRDNLERGAPGTMTEIKNPTGEVAFRVYEVILNR